MIGPVAATRWFQDQTAGVLESPSIFSVPMWVYRALFFAWASWMAFALVRWLRWAFNAWKTDGLWRVTGTVPRSGKSGIASCSGLPPTSEQRPVPDPAPLRYSQRPSR